MPRSESKFVCSSCGFQSPRWLGRCPECGEWNTMVEETEVSRQKHKSSQKEEAVILAQDLGEETRRFSGGMEEFDRVLGGGFVEGSVILLGGEPGIGKSTLLLSVSDHVASSVGKVLYASGEESLAQVRMRAGRLGVRSQNLFFISTRDIDSILSAADGISPRLLIVDSIQTCEDSEATGLPGGPSQVQACAVRLQEYAKSQNVTCVLVGHSIKSGGLSGPRLLEHLVDTVLFFEGDSNHLYRVIRAHKNRFGPTNEVAVFEMEEKGLREIKNPSEFFLSERVSDQPGASIAVCLKGRNPLCVQVESLVASCPYGTPRRVAGEVDYQRALLILAVLTKKLGLGLDNRDVYLKVAGGIRVDEPGLDLAAALAVVSSYYDVSIKPQVAFFGEIGLSGEVRAVPRMGDRMREALRVGFESLIVPRSFAQKEKGNPNIIGVSSLEEAVRNALTKNHL